MRRRMINKTGTTYAKGIAIIFVIAGHLSLTNCGINSPFSYLGAYGVAIFLMLSGYGLIKSYQTNGLKDFFKKRFLKMYVPYSIITVVWMAVLVILLKENLSMTVMLKNILAIDTTNAVEPSMWYITYILIWYLLFWIIFKTRLYKFIKVLLISLMPVLIYYMYNNGILPSLISWAYMLYSIFFPLGVLIGAYDDKFKTIFKNSFVSIAIVSLLFIFYMANMRMGTFEHFHYKYYLLAISSMSATILLSAMLMQKFLSNIRLLKLIGDFSYYLYLVEGFWLFKYSILKIIPDKIFAIPVYLCIVLICAYILKKVNELVHCSLNSYILSPYKLRDFKDN